MGITINIHGNGAETSAHSDADLVKASMDAGQSVALGPDLSAAPDAQLRSRDRAIDGGAPSATLMQEVGAALGVGNPGGPDSMSSTDAINAGEAPK
jgi:hypothetical protein